MALTVNITRMSKIDRESVREGTIDFGASYPTGGESLTPANLNLQDINHIDISSKNGYLFEYDYANKKVKVLYFDYDAAADGAAIEVANGTDLSALTGVRFRAYGY